MNDSKQTLQDLIEKAAERFPQHTAFSCMGRRLSYAELYRDAISFAAYCNSELKLKKGDCLAIMLPNILQYPLVLFGAIMAGLTVVNINPLDKAPSIAHELRDSGARAIIVLENFAYELQKALPETLIESVIVTSIGALLPGFKGLLTDFYLRYIARQVPGYHFRKQISFSDALKLGRNCDFKKVRVATNDLAFIQYTGGTTGIAKGVMLSHDNLMSNLFQVRAWVADHLQEGREVIITALPLYHIFSLLVNCFLFVLLGGTSVLVPNPRDIPSLVQVFKKYQPSCFSGVNTLFNALLHNSQFCDMDHSSLKLSIGGGMAVQQGVADKWQKITGKVLIQGYGLTETSPVVTIMPFESPVFNGSIGLPVKGTELSIQDPAGHILPVNTTGELCVRGPQVMQGYFARPEETAVALKQGWLHTADAAYQDENGLYYLVDRLKDMVIVSGFNVYPAEVENLIKSIPGVDEVAVIGIANIEHGEVIKAFVVKEQAADLTETAIIDFCHQFLAAYKCPHEVEFIAALPKSAVGKILKKDLR